nr:reverse transcriptase domain, reverse transcriptase zinc-binding domain protein [Tanacetum cinerariifolium]
MRLGENWSNVIDSFVRRLSSWKAKVMSIGGRLSLVKAVLGSLPLYVLSIVRAPNQVLNKLESIRYRFFWGFKDDEKKIVWIKWLNVLKSKSAGGLDVGLIRAKNLDARVLRSRSGVWPDILRSIEEINKIGVPLDSLGKLSLVMNGNREGVWAWRSLPRERADSDLHSLEHLLSGLSLQPEKDDA